MEKNLLSKNILSNVQENTPTGVFSVSSSLNNIKQNIYTILDRPAHKANETKRSYVSSFGKVAVLLIFFLTSVSNLHSQYCMTLSTNLAITVGTTSTNTPTYSAGTRAFNFVATAGCTYTFATCGLTAADTYLRLYSTGTGKTPSVDNNSFSSNTSYFFAAQA